jgi:hypothetical protein
MWEHRGPMSAITHSCASCGTELPVGARFCASCGARAARVDRPVSWSTSERLRHQAAQLDHDRARQLHALGVAVYRRDRNLAAHIRVGIGELDRRMEAVGDELRRVERRVEEQIARARMEGGPTNIVEPDAPEPPIVPEPEPVPHDPPGPVIVPEPEPVPHEPPGPVIVPEPKPPTE